MGSSIPYSGMGGDHKVISVDLPRVGRRPLIRNRHLERAIGLKLVVIGVAVLVVDGASPASNEELRINVIKQFAPGASRDTDAH